MDERGLRCPVCALPFPAIAEVRAHLLRVHAVQVQLDRPEGFPCQTCGHHLGTYRGWVQHNMNYHVEQVAHIDEENVGQDHGVNEENMSVASDNASGDSEESAGTVNDDPMDSLQTLANGRKDPKHAAVRMVVEMRSVPAMTRVGVSRAIAGAELVLKVNNMSLKEDVANFLTTIGQRHTPAAEELLSKFDSNYAYKGIKSNVGQISGIKKYYHYLTPQTCYVNDRVDLRQGEEGAYRQVNVPNTYEYVSPIDILTMVARKRTVMQKIRNLHPSQDGKLYGYVDGDQFTEHEFFKEHEDAFQLALYGDAADPARSQGPKSGFHSVFNFYLIILNLPPYIKYSLDSIFPVIMANDQDCDGTFEQVLRLLVNDLQRLESPDGVPVFIATEGDIVLRGALVAVKGDSEAVHKMLGFLACGARCFCRQCMITRQQLHDGMPAFGEKRTPELSEIHLALIEQNQHYRTECGLKVRTCLHDLGFFRAEKNHNFDLMHDGAHGVCLMLIRLVLQKFICEENLFTVNQFNARINAFNYGKQNIRDKPTANFTVESLQLAERNHKQKMNAAQVMVLLRAFPFLIDNLGNGVDEDNIYLQYIILLLKIYQLASAPCIPREQLPYLSRLLDIFRRTWYDIFPNVNPINKFHHLMHLPENTAVMGPQRQYWCYKEEQTNCPGKRHVSACNNFKNPPKTAMEQAQIRVTKVWGTDDHDIKRDIKFVKKINVPVNTLPTAVQLNALGFNGNINICTAVEVEGLFEFRIGEFVMTRKASDNITGRPSFGKIVSIMCPRRNELIWLGVQPWANLGLVEHLNAYSVALHGDPPCHLIDIRDIPMHPPITQWNDYSSDNLYLVLMYLVF